MLKINKELRIMINMFLFIVLIVIPNVSCTSTYKINYDYSIKDTNLVKASYNIQDIKQSFIDNGVDKEYLYIVIAEQGFDRIWTKQSNYNLFGFTIDGVNYLKFSSIDKCVKYFKWWLSFSPRKPNEDIVNYLIRRKWNTRIEYYQYFREVMWVNKYKEFIYA